MIECVRVAAIDISHQNTSTLKQKLADIIDHPAVKNDARDWPSWKRSQQHNLAVTLSKHEIKEYGDDFFEIVEEREREVRTVEISWVYSY